MPRSHAAGPSSAYSCEPCVFEDLAIGQTEAQQCRTANFEAMLTVQNARNIAANLGPKESDSDRLSPSAALRHTAASICATMILSGECEEFRFNKRNGRVELKSSRPKLSLIKNGDSEQTS